MFWPNIFVNTSINKCILFLFYLCSCFKVFCLTWFNICCNLLTLKSQPIEVESMPEWNPNSLKCVFCVKYSPIFLHQLEGHFTAQNGQQEAQIIQDSVIQGKPWNRNLFKTSRIERGRNMGPALWPSSWSPYVESAWIPYGHRF